MAIKQSVTKSITAQNTFSDIFRPFNHPEKITAELVDISISGTFVATVVLQRSFDEGVTWHDVSSWTGINQSQFAVASTCLYRIGVKTGGFTSGTVVVGLYQ